MRRPNFHWGFELIPAGPQVRGTSPMPCSMEHGMGLITSPHIDLGLPLWAGLRRCLPMCRPVRGLAPTSHGTVDPYTAPRGWAGAHSFPRGPRGRSRKFCEPPPGFLPQRAGNYGVPAVFPAFYWVSPLGPRERSRNLKISHRSRPRPPAGTKNARSFSNYGE